MRYAHPDGNVFYRKMAHARPRAVKAEGCWIEDEDGKRYLDASGGPLVVNIGHGRAEVVEAMREQAAACAYVHASMFTTTALEAYSAALAKRVPMAHPRFYFLSSGSEVVEASIKLARQVQQARGEKRRSVVISRSQSYHGMTLGALAQSGRPGLRAPYVEMMTAPPQIAPPYPYRDPRSGAEMADLLEERILEVGAENVAAFLAEPISGASLGAVVPDDHYWPRVREICDRHGVLLIADEVLVGLGRTGAWWGLDHWGVKPDILVSSKGTAGGYMPLGLVAVESAEVDRIQTALGDFNHGGTFSHHAVAAAAGLATLEILEREKLVERSAELGAKLGARLKQRFARHPHVGDVRGRGMFWALELVERIEDKHTFEAARKIAPKVHAAAFERGLIVYYSQGCADGTRGDLVMVGPPFVLGEDEIELIVEGLAAALDDVVAE
jgi:adenosylmethionine-8-amino-7-oxononanoate aminotransferase